MYSIKLGFLLPCLLCCVNITLSSSIASYYEITGALLSDVNTIYLCRDINSCVSIDSKFILSSKFRIGKHNQAERIWYIKSDTHISSRYVKETLLEQHKTPTVDIYGAIEIEDVSRNENSVKPSVNESNASHFQHALITKPWKRINNNIKIEFASLNELQTASPTQNPSYTEELNVMVVKTHVSCLQWDSGVTFNWRDLKHLLVIDILNHRNPITNGNVDTSNNCFFRGISTHDTYSAAFNDNPNHVIGTNASNPNTLRPDSVVNLLQTYIQCSALYLSLYDMLECYDALLLKYSYLDGDCHSNLSGVSEANMSDSNPEVYDKEIQWFSDTAILQCIQTEIPAVGCVLDSIRIKYVVLLLRHQLQIGKAIDVLSASGFLTRANPNISPRNVNSYMHMSVLHSVLVCMLHDTIQCEENMRTGLRIEVRKKFEEILQQFCDYCTSDIMNDHILHAISHTCYMMQHEGDVNSIHSALSLIHTYNAVGASEQGTITARNALYSHASVPYPSTIDFSGLDVEVARRDIYGLLHVAKMHDKLDEFLQNGMLCSLYISTLLQMTAPTVIPDGFNSLRAWHQCVDSLELLLSICHPIAAIPNPNPSPNAYKTACYLHDPINQVNVRGLFLLAYQAYELPSSTSINNQGAYNRMYSDVTIPWLYYKLLLHTSLTGQVPFPWDYHGAVYVNSSVAADIPGDKFNMTTSQIPVSNPNTGRRRIAFLSSFWFEHSVGKLLANVAMGLYTNGDELGYIVDIIQISSCKDNDVDCQTHDDALTQELHENCHSWIRIASGSSGALNRGVEQIRRLKYDAIVFGDMYMDSFTLHLGMFRMSPVQIAFWGHPYTTGLEHSMDYFISSSMYEQIGPSQPVDTRISTNADGGGNIASNYYTMQHVDYRMHNRRNMFSEQLVIFDSLSFAFHDRDSRGKAEDASRSAGCGSRRSSISSLAEYLSTHGKTLLAGKVMWDKDSPDFHANSGVESHINDSPTFYGLLQSIMKLHPMLDATIIRLLTVDGSISYDQDTSIRTNGVVVLQYNNRQLLHHEQYRKRLLKAVHTHCSQLIGTDQNKTKQLKKCIHGLSSRILFIPQVAHSVYKELLCKMHVNLDPFPFGGGVTLMDSCLCGVPFVTLPQMQAVHALGHGIAQQYIESSKIYSIVQDKLNSTSFIAGSIEQYVDKAVTLAHSYKHGRIPKATMNCCDQYSNSNEVVTEWRRFLLSAIAVSSERDL